MKKNKKERVDQLMLDRGLAPTLAKARAMIMAGEVIAGEHRVDKAGVRIPVESSLRVKSRRGHIYVSRGGLKLEGALNHFKINPTDWTCLDLGMSTGGFTDCLLKRGARHIYGVDVGRGLAHESLRVHTRVTLLEGTHARDLNTELIPHKCDLCVADISFNSLTRLIQPALPLMKAGGTLLLLIKPQFELSSDVLAEVSTSGVVFDEAAQERACQTVADHLTSLGVNVVCWVPSQHKGAKGNQEYFVLAHT